MGFKLVDVSPIIAEVIQSIPGREDGFRSHSAIVDRLLAYPASMALIAAARMGSKQSDNRIIAATMMAKFSQAITMRQSPWGSKFDRKKQGKTYAYRPKHE